MNTTGTRIRSTIILASALILAACSDSGNEPGSPIPTDGMPLRFAADSRDARAEITINSLRSFNVWASLRNPDSATAAERNWRDVFSNAQSTTPTIVNLTDTDGWTYGEDLRYWQRGFSYTFLAFADAYEADAYEADAPTVAPAFNTAANGNSHFLSISNFNGTHSTDLAYATEARDLTTEPLNTSVVNLTFHHLTSLIEIVGRVDPLLGQNYKIQIVDVFLYGMNTIGSWSGESFNPAASDLGTWTSSAPSIATSPYAEVTGKRFIISTNDKTPKNLLHPNADIGHNVMMIPQEIPIDARVKIDYRHIGRYDEPDETGHAIHSLTLNLYEASLAVGGVWQPGKVYRYTVNFGADDNIIFDTPTVDQWTYQVGGNIIVQ